MKGLSGLNTVLLLIVGSGIPAEFRQTGHPPRYDRPADPSPLQKPFENIYFSRAAPPLKYPNNASGSPNAPGGDVPNARAPESFQSKRTYNSRNEQFLDKKEKDGKDIYYYCKNIVAGGFTLPGSIESEIWNLITNGTVEHIFGCQSYDNFTEDDIAYNLFNRENDYPITLTLNNLCELDSSKDTKVLFNGWGQTAHEEEILDMVNAYLTRYDCNVITVEYANLSNVQYSQAYCNIQKGAELMSDFFCQVYNEGYLNFDQVHMVGFSLGAQVIGLIGQHVQQKCNQKIDRLTGLDPAGPIYQNQNISMRLDKTDAKFVDAIHTNMGMFGYYGSVGHVDFFPNCGTSQPGCLQVNDFPDVIKIIVNFIVCSHGSSLVYFTESIYDIGPVFNSTSCSLCPNSDGAGKCRVADVIKPQYTIMGEDCPRNPPAKRFLVHTNSKPPYAQG